MEVFFIAVEKYSEYFNCSKARLFKSWIKESFSRPFNNLFCLFMASKRKVPFCLNLNTLSKFCGFRQRNNNKTGCVCETRMPPLATKSRIGYFYNTGPGQVHKVIDLGVI